MVITLKKFIVGLEYENEVMYIGEKGFVFDPKNAILYSKNDAYKTMCEKCGKHGFIKLYPIIIKKKNY